MVIQTFYFQYNNDELTLCVYLNRDSLELSSEEIINNIMLSEYANLFILEEQIAHFVSITNKKLLAVIKNNLPEKELFLVAAKVKHANITLAIAKDNMSVEATVIKEFGGKPVTLNTIKQYCINAGVRYGLKNSLITELLSKCDSAKPGDVIRHVIAQGLPEVHGNDAFIKPLVNLFSSSFRAPKENTDGSVNLRDLGNIDTVEINTPVLQKTAATEGKHGIDVFCDKIIPNPGKDIFLPLNPTVHVSPDNIDILLASQEGLARYNGKEIHIDDVYILPELTPKQGNIKFKGSVVIRGDVSPEMKIAATGDVLIGGFVESAIIKCGGELTIISGASGRALDNSSHSQHYTCILQSGGQINLDFANQCEITAKTLINVKRQLSHCIVEASSAVIGVGKKPNGQINGGRLFLCKTLEAGVIGMESHIPTDISMNRTYDLFIIKEIELANWIQEITTRREKLEVTYNSIMDPAKKFEMKPKLIKLTTKIDKYVGYRKALIEKRRKYMGEIYIKVNKKLFPKVSFFVTDNAIISEQEKGPSVIKMDDFELKILPLI